MNFFSKIFITTAVFFILIPFVFSAQAASLNFDKSTVTVSGGGTFQISVTLDPGSDAINSSDVYVIYDSALLKATSVSAGTLFPTVTNDISTSGKVYIAGMVDDPASSVSSAGTIASITFESLKEGSGTLSFDCNLSKIVKNDINATNVIVCGSNGTSAVTVGAGNSTADTTTDNTVAPAELPQSGIFENVANIAVPGIILLLLGSIFRLVL